MRLYRLQIDPSDDELSAKDAIDVLVARVENYVVAFVVFKGEEAKSLSLRAGTRIGGPMSRQPNEPMTPYIRRRGRLMIPANSP